MTALLLNASSHGDNSTLPPAATTDEATYDATQARVGVTETESDVTQAPVTSATLEVTSLTAATSQQAIKTTGTATTSRNGTSDTANSVSTAANGRPPRAWQQESGLRKLCRHSATCNCHFQHTSMSVVCSQWGNNGETFSQAIINQDE